MPEDIAFITARRAYEFRPDDLRLSMLSIKPIQDEIQKLFNFQSSSIGSPMRTFGEVQLTIPPGLVFNMGVWVSPGNQLLPIRFLNFEPRRIVIDVGGSSEAITPIFERLQQFLAGLKAQDGSPPIGKPESILDYSEISARFPFPLDAIVSPPLRQLLSRIIKERVLVPTLVTQSFPGGQVLSGTANIGDHHAFTLAPRAGNRIEDHKYFSGAPLDTEAHLSYLNELEAALTS